MEGSTGADFAYNDFSFMANPVPVPGAAALFVPALIADGIARRKRAAA